MRPIFKMLAWIVILFSYPIAKAQDPGSVSGHTLWLEPLEFNDTLITKKLKNPKDIAFAYFNFNPVLDLQSQKKKIFKNIITEQYSLFTVFKSDFEEERNVVAITRGKKKVYLTNKEVLSDKEMLYKQVNSRQGIILSYINGNNDKNGKKRNSLEIVDMFGEDKEGREQLLELLYFPKLLSNSERQKVETYLSLKYGISILGDFDYIASGNEKIWDHKENSTYNKRVTGIGRDDVFNLYQKQSGNSQKDGLYIGLGVVDTTNAENSYKIANHTFLLWGDNAGITALLKDKKNNNLKIMERIWKMQSTTAIQQDSIITQVKLNKKELGYASKPDSQEFLWLAVNTMESPKFDYSGANYYRQSYEDDDFVYFNNVVWDRDRNGSDIFTFIQGPDFFIEHKESLTCADEAGKLTVRMGGGTPPYSINLISSVKNESISTGEDHYEFSNLQGNAYKLTVTDSKNKSQSIDTLLDAFAKTGLSLAPLWYLNESGEVVISASVPQNDAGLSFEWKKGSTTVSTEKELTAKEAGDYSLVATTSLGCSKEIPFKVKSRIGSMTSGWKLYPNPVKKSEMFTIKFNLEKESDVVMSINSMEGKEVLYKNLGKIKDFEYRESITTAGVYLITVTINNIPETVKLIIH